MKTQFFLIAALSLPLGLRVASAQDFSRSTSTLSREDFADRNAQELRQVRAQIDELARRSSLMSDTRLAPLYDALSDAENALAAWKIAGPEDLTQRSKDYEQTRSKLLSLLNDSRATLGQTGTTP